ncbi:MAG: sigma-54-dependent Fis family transcriptional regulator [Flavobacteriales bacterium]|nr:Regulatory protein AtoC [Flavobacteriales bacterium]MCC6578300.1 sigma-54-dependent Fis family transcriptional regulator [Flavobacteriales bacterium]NUQ15148.1 sigma-54-dependent Fis family transcriptional regulator [Flavobacteriales bacterium]
MSMPHAPSVLLVDDARDMLELLRRSVNAMGLTPFTADNAVDAIGILEQGPVDVVITDLNMPGVSGIQLVRYLGEHHPRIPVLVITGYPKLEDAVQVMKLGAVEYLVKPFTQEELRQAVERVLRAIGAMPSAAPPPATVRDGFHGLLGRSRAMQEVYRVIERTSNNKATVLVTGESGTGKEMVARAIHYNSASAAAPFIAVNCGAIPDQLLESELFGHMKGAFTGATTSRAGFFQAADGGTLFLDEIGNASPAVQAKLLRAIQDKEITMLGATRPQRVDVRLISAANNDLPAMIRQGGFREDLYYRLNLIHIHLPPLRDRTEDLPRLVDHFNHRFSRELGKPPLRITPPVLETFAAYPWPGNVRELEHLVHRLVILLDGTVATSDLPMHMRSPAPRAAVPDTLVSLAAMERQHIRAVLEAVAQNKTKAAAILGIDRKTLRGKLKDPG